MAEETRGEAPIIANTFLNKRRVHADSQRVVLEGFKCAGLEAHWKAPNLTVTGLDMHWKAPDSKHLSSFKKTGGEGTKLSGFHENHHDFLFSRFLQHSEHLQIL
jgi:hypothetical protein